jgi:PAS domain-containing protein
LADLEAMAMPAVVLDLDGKILALNTTAIRLGARQRDEIVGRLAWEFAPGLEYLWDERIDAARAPEGGTFEIAITTRRGALMLEYVLKVYELDGQPAVVALITKARPLT